MKDKSSLLVINKSIQDESISSVFWEPLETDHSKIEEMIQEHVGNNEFLEPTLTKVSNKIGSILNGQELLFCEETYTFEVLKRFNDEFQTFLAKLINLSSSGTQEIADLVKNAHSIEEVCQCFDRKLTSAPLLQSCHRVLKQAEKVQFVHEVKKECLKVLLKTTKTKENEVKFLMLLQTFLDEEFVASKCSSFDKIPIITGSCDTKSLLKNVLKTCQKRKKSSNDELEVSTQNLLDSDGFSMDFEKTLEAELKRFKTPVKIEKMPRLNGRVCIQFFAMGLTTQKISDELKKAKYDEVEVHVQQVLVINSNVTLPGKNLVLACPNIKITTKVTIDLSGKDALPMQNQKAKNGTKSGGHGHDGQDGDHGQSGGNLLILSDSIDNGARLNLISNGGSGANGQAGGDGQNGQDGKDGASLNLKTLDQFNAKFPDLRIFEGNERNRKQRQILDMINIDKKKYVSVHGGYDRSVRGKMSDGGFPIIYGNYVACYVFTNTISSFILVEGLHGTTGTSGGNAGSGGCAGLGGFPGEKAIKGLKNRQCQGSVNVGITKGSVGSSGQNGKNGKAGQGGRNGIKGADCARVEPGYCTQQYFYYGNLGLSLCSAFAEGRAWCIEREKYVGISRNSSPSPTYAKNGQKAKQISEQQHSQQHLRQVPILEQNVRQTFKSFEHCGTKMSETSYLEMEDNYDMDKEELQIEFQQNYQRCQPAPQSFHEAANEKLHIPNPLVPKIDKMPDVQNEFLKEVLLNVAQENMSTKTLVGIFRDLDSWCRRNNLTETDGKEIGFIIEKVRMFVQCIDLDHNDLIDLDEALYNLVLTLCSHMHLVKRILTLRLLAFEQFKQVLLGRTTTDIEKRLEVLEDDHLLIENPKIYQSVILSLIHQVEDVSLFPMPKLTEHKSTKSSKVKQKENMKGIFTPKSSKLKQKEKLKLTFRRMKVKILCIIRLGRGSQSLKTRSYEKTQLVLNFNTTAMQNYQRFSLVGQDDGEQSNQLEQTGYLEGVKNWFGNRKMESDNQNDPKGPGGDTKRRMFNIKNPFGSSKTEPNKVSQVQEFVEYIEPIESKPSFETLMEQIENDHIKELISKFKYYDNEELTKVIESLVSKLVLNGIFIDSTELSWLLVKLMTDLNADLEFVLEEFQILISTNTQKQWLPACINTQMASIFDLTHEQSVQFMDLCKTLRQRDILILLSQKMDEEMDIETDLNFENVLSILKLSQSFELDDLIVQQLSNLDTSTWGLRLKWFHYLSRVSSEWTVTPKLIESEIHAITYYLAEIEHKYGENHCDKLQKSLLEKTMEKPVIMELLQNINKQKWILDERTLKILNEEKSSNWLEKMSQSFMSKEERSVSDLAELIVRNGNNSDHIRKNINQVERLVKIIENARGSNSNLTKYVDNNQSQDAKLCEQLAKIDQAIWEKHAFYLRSTQLVAIITFLKTEDQGILEQVSTGEGKSLIIVALAIVKALQGESVDVITSSSVLAERDSKEHVDIYAKFGLKVGHNCRDSKYEKQKVYTQCDVVYGDVAAFQRDFLMNSFYGEDNGIGGRKIGCVIVDEVDSMLLDKGHNIMYLSHTIPGMDALEPIFVFIWNLVHGKDISGDDDMETLHKVVQSAMYPLLRIEELQEVIELDSVQDTWDSLIQAKVIDQTGKLLEVKKIKANEIELKKVSKKGIILNLLKDKVIDQTGKLLEVKKIKANEIELKKVSKKGIILNLLKDIIRRGVEVNIPEELLNFVELHLKEWIKNALLARLMTLNEDYIIDIDRSENAVRSQANIVIMDNQTGVEQYHSQWSNGLHQFLQLKHACRISLESLKAVFISNVTFFRRYKTQIFGLSGTLGSESEKNFLQTIYKISFAIIPTFKQSRFIEEVPTLCSTEQSWKKTISVKTLENLKKRAVLIICENVAAVDKLQDTLKNCCKKQIYIYKRSYEPLLGSEEVISQPCLIIATNLAGRGTDLKISESLSEQGGLHVIISYLPESVRVEEQAFGRSARKGQQGSGEIICMPEKSMESSKTSNLDVMIELKVQRNTKESKHVSSIKQSYLNTIKPEEELFAEFQSAYRDLVVKLQKQKNFEFEAALVQQNVLDNWAFWLDEINVQYGDSLKKVSTVEFLSKIQDAIQNQDRNYVLKLIDKSAHKIKLANHYIENKNWPKAESLLNSVIEKDIHFQPMAYYFMAHLLIRKENPKTRKDCAKMFECLALAKKGFNDQMQLHSQFNGSISFISKNYQEQSKQSFLLVNDFEAQKKDIIDMFNIFVRTIDDILGSEPSSQILESDKVDLITASKLMELLQSEGKMAPAKVLKTDCKDILQDKYEVYILDILDILSKRVNSKIKSEDFQGILPSREHFWLELVRLNILKNEQKLLVIDMDQLKEKAEVYNEWTMLKKLNTFEATEDTSKCFEDVFFAKETRELDQSSDTKKVCLYPQMIKDIQDGKKNFKIVTLQEFEKNFDKIDNWKTFLVQNIIQENSVAILAYKDGQKMQSFSGISNSSFRQIEGSVSVQEVIKSLKKDKVLLEIKDGRTILNEEAFAEGNWHQSEKISEFKTEIGNLVTKSFKYDMALEELKAKGDISLPSRSEEELWEDLIAFDIVQPKMIDSNVSESDLRSCIEQLIDVNRKTMLYFFTKSIDEEKDGTVKKLTSALYGTKSGLLALDTPDSSLKPLMDYLTPEDMHRKSTELQQFSSNALEQTVVLIEQKYSWKAIFGMVCIFILGMVQLIIGVAVMVGSLGSGTFLASGLISEGIGDMMFALESAYTGYFSWKSYAIHKAISLAFTVITCGVGAYFSRGAKFSKFGYKIGGDFFKKLSYRKLAEKGLGNVILKQAAFYCGKKVVQTVALSAGNFALKKISEQLQKSLIDQICEKTIMDLDFSDSSQQIKTLCDHVGTEKAEEILQQVTEKVFGPGSELRQQLTTLMGYLNRTKNSLFEALGNTASKTNNGDLAMVLTVTNYVTKAISIGETLADATTCVNNMHSKLQMAIQNACEKEVSNTSKKAKKSHKKTSDEVSIQWIAQWKGQIKTEVSDKITSTIIEPVLNFVGHKLASKATKYVKNACKSYREAKEWKAFNKIKEAKQKALEGSNDAIKHEIHQKYDQEMVELLSKTKNPKLYAELVREGVPMGVLGLKAISNAVGRPIQVINQDGTPSSEFPADPDPPPGEPIVIIFEPGKTGKDGHAGHFLAKNSKDQESQSQAGRNDCLLEAVNAQEGKTISRDQVANVIEKDPFIQEHIRLGIDKHFIKRAGALGGLKRTETKEQSMRNYLNQLPDNVTGKDIKKDKLRDKAQIDADDAIKATGGHELIPCDQLPDVLAKDSKDEVAKMIRKKVKPGASGDDQDKDFDRKDGFIHLRVDTGLVVWKYYDEEKQEYVLQGHSGALWDDNELRDGRLRLKGQMNKGQDGIHDKLRAAYAKGGTPQEVSKNVLKTHLETTATGHEIRQMTNLENTHSVFKNGDLSKPEGRNDFSLRVDRQRSAAYEVLKCQGGDVDDKLKPPDDWYSKEIRNHLARAGNPSSKEFMKAAFDVLSKKPPSSKELPANFGFGIPRKPSGMRRPPTLRNRNRPNRRTGVRKSGKK